MRMLLTCFSSSAFAFFYIYLEKLPDIAKLPGNELADASDFSGKQRLPRKHSANQFQ
jgi:hypothetical protein